MKPLIQLKNPTPLVFIALLLACLAPARLGQAVVPPPDGGYPGFNTAEVQNALFSLTTGVANTAVGWSSLSSDTTGSFNTATGAGALLFNTANNNTAFGAAALLFNTTGSLNTAVGQQALFSSTGTSNTALGFAAGSSVTTANNVICIGASGANVDNTTWIGNVYGHTPQSGTTAPVIVSDGGQLGTAASSERFKKDITAMQKASEAILSLRPVTFHYKTDTRGTLQFGLIAEEVAQVNPNLVVRDKNGEIYSVRYEAVNAMLLNEFLKEHRTVQELKSNDARQEATIAHQQKQIEALTAGLQKMSAQLKLSKAAPQTVVNNQ